MVRPPAALRPLLDGFVPVRVTDLRGVDLRALPFDFDLTLSVLTLHADGTVLHRYGGRDHRDPEAFLSLASYEAFLRASLASHAGHVVAPVGPGSADETGSPGLSGELPGEASSRRSGDRMAPGPDPARLPWPMGEPATAELAPLVLERVPAYAAKDKGACIHCHSVYPALHAEAVRAGTWDDAERWRYPGPARLGLTLDRDDQRRVVAVAEGSVAEAAGVTVGDRLASLDEVRLATATDLMFALDRLPAGGATVDLRVERPSRQPDGDRVLTLSLDLADGWKRTEPERYAWRPFKWAFTPQPGFGGRALTAAELVAAGLVAPEVLEADGADATGAPPLPFALRVTYLVTWGDRARYGRAAAAAGLRGGDVVVAVTGREGTPATFTSPDHLHAWWRLTREVGETVRLEVLRGGARRVLELDVLP